MRTTKRIVALATLAAFSQMACYNTYFISKTELRKLESSVDQKEQVKVYGDCPDTGESAALDTDRPLYAQADEAPADEAPVEEAAPEAGAEETATDAAPAETPAETVEETAATDAPAEEGATNTTGCTEVNVSTNNALKIVTNDGEEKRVTPFNFIMSGGQLVSPEYDLLENLNDVDGAEVSEFSTWKTVGTIVGVSATVIGTFVAVGLLAGESTKFD